MSCKHEKRTEREWRCRHGVCGHHLCRPCVEEVKAEECARRETRLIADAQRRKAKRRPHTAQAEIEQLKGVIADAQRRIQELERHSRHF